jgi:hypothetical protein
VTVCIAALCQWNGVPIVLGASDRMLTSADITFEPPASKIYSITNSIHALIAGDATIHAEIYPKVFARVSKMISAKPLEWVRVEEVARIYGDETLQYRKRTATRMVLEPLGLTWDTFMSKQKDMSPDFLDDLSSKILEMRPDSRIIVAGLDESGAHIWMVDGYGKASCGDKAGFVAIGIGKRHAESEFMFDGHYPNSTFYETLLRAYAAKKRAEVAPGVGERTDMFIIAGLGAAVSMNDETLESWLPQLSEAYNRMNAKQIEAKKEASKEITEFFDTALKQFIEESKKTQAEPEIKPLPPAPNGGDQKYEG